jgi:hypothetical protein
VLILFSFSFSFVSLVHQNHIDCRTCIRANRDWECGTAITQNCMQRGLVLNVQGASCTHCHPMCGNGARRVLDSVSIPEDNGLDLNDHGVTALSKSVGQGLNM